MRVVVLDEVDVPGAVLVHELALDPVVVEALGDLALPPALLEILHYPM
jgi:hypothetical protein